MLALFGITFRKLESAMLFNVLPSMPFLLFFLVRSLLMSRLHTKRASDVQYYNPGINDDLNKNILYF